MAADEGQVYYTDGSAIEKQTLGGHGFCTMLDGKWYDYAEQGAGQISNNRMEMLAAIRAIQHAKSIGQPVATIMSDSQYVIRSMTPKKSDLCAPDRAEYKRKKNVDLWTVLIAEASTMTVYFKYVKAHNGDPGNERADSLAVLAANQSR